MKLRNRKTGEIIEVESLDVGSPTEGIVGIPSFDRKGSYNSLAELNKEWEDYEEPKKYYWIDYDGKVKSFIDLYGWQDKMKENGNYFETEEEAEKAVEKLKAWKRLKDRGFKFDGYNACSVDYDIDEQYRKNISEDLNLLFGGEE